MRRGRFVAMGVSVCAVALTVIALVNGAEKFPLKDWPKGIVCAGGSAGSAYYTLMVGVSELSTKYLSVKGTTISLAGGSGAGIRGMHKGEVDFATITDEAGYSGIKGIGPYKEKPIHNVRAVVGHHLTLFCVATDAKYGIKSMADLKGTGYAISLDPQGSPAFRAAAAAVLEFYGLGPKDVRSIPHSDKAEIVSGLKEGRFKVVCEAGYTTSAMPYFMELDRDLDLRMIPLSKECIDYVLKKVPGFAPGSVPPGLYKGVTNEVPTIGVSAGVFCRAEIPESLVYEITRLIFEQPSRGDWERLAPHHRSYLPERIADFLTPAHAGAVKYYKEKGVWTPELENRRQETLAAIGMKN